VTIQKKSLISNLQATKKAIVASTPTETPISGKIMPRARARLTARVVAKAAMRVTAIR
jgi:hypothetical protein